MIDSVLDFALGPFRSISGFYFENQTVFNAVVIGAVLLQMARRKKRVR
ncbi:MAG: hypothetical protein LOD88_08840 [Novibacillus thermophilus]|jgi:hypothetical protein|nr:hypothetical protein [Novibacillus thermophilus]